ncbi:MAG: SEL1-like repeat protein [Elusimicrobiota bacterium]|nr:SEL1-like repeat protein [Elusimicrobiota bacterium]
MRKILVSFITLLVFCINTFADSNLDLTQKAAKDGDVQAQVKLGQMYFRGDEIKKDDKMAFRWFMAASQKDYPEAQYWVGYMYENGFGVSKDLDKASQYYMNAAAKGNSDAQFALGNIYLSREDITNASLWFDQARGSNNILAAEKSDEIARQAQRSDLQKDTDELFLRAYGDSEAMFLLGQKYQDAQVIEGDAIPDYNTAIYWYRLASQKGYIPALLRLGNIYQSGEIFIKSDPQKAFDYYIQAAEQNSVIAQLEIAHMFKIGFGTPVSLTRAFYWYSRAAAQGNAEGYYNVGLMFEEGLGIGKNYRRAFDYYLMAADKGHLKAKFRLGRMFQLGLGVHQNNAEAFTLFKQAADLGDITAQYEIGKIYKDALIGIAQNDVEAVRYLSRAASRGSLAAKTELDYMVAQGRVVPSQLMEALSLRFDTGLYSDNPEVVGGLVIEALVPFEYSAQAGDIRAQYELARMYQRGVGGLPQSNLNAFKWFLKSAQGGYALAQLELGTLYERAAAVNQNNTRQYNIDAVMWYKRAAQQGNGLAQLNLGKIYDVGVEGVPGNALEAQQWYTKASLQSGPIANEAKLLLTALQGELAEVRAFEEQAVAAAAKKQTSVAAKKPAPKKEIKKAAPKTKKPTAYDLLLQRAQKGDSQAQYELGLQLYNPKAKKPISKTDIEAFNWFTRSAAKGNANAKYALAVMYYRGDGVSEDPKKAFALFLDAGRAGNEDARKSLYYIFTYGDPKIGIDKDLDEAAKWAEIEKTDQANSAQKIESLKVISDVLAD